MSSRERQQADLERWAANFLSAPPEDAAAVRSRFLQLVDQQNCFPAQDVSLALEVLTGQIKPDPGQPSQGLVWSLVEDEIGQDVDRFACDFFALDRAERRQRWQTLQMRGAWSPVLTARLKELKPGLEMDGADLPGDAEERAVALRLQELFVLTPAARAARRREIIAEFSAKSSHWQLVVKQVGQKFPALATLDPELFRHCGRDRLGRHFSGPNPQPNDGRLGLSTWLGSLIVIGFVLFLVSLFDNPSKQRQPKPWHQERKRIFQELFKLQDQKVGVPKDGGNAPNNRDRDRLP